MSGRCDVEQPLHVRLVDEVELGLAHGHQLRGRAAALLQALHDRGAEEPPGAGHDDLLRLQVDHSAREITLPGAALPPAGRGRDCRHRRRLASDSPRGHPLPRRLGLRGVAPEAPAGGPCRSPGRGRARPALLPALAHRDRARARARPRRVAGGRGRDVARRRPAPPRGAGRDLLAVLRLDAQPAGAGRGRRGVVGARPRPARMAVAGRAVRAPHLHGHPHPRALRDAPALPAVGLARHRPVVGDPRIFIPNLVVLAITLAWIRRRRRAAR